MKRSTSLSTTNEKSRSWVKVEGGPVIACIDMGTNSFHMIVCQASLEREHFEVIVRRKEAVPFFRRALTAHFIDEMSLREAIKILQEMKKTALEKGASTIIAVATSAVRESKNGFEVLERVRRQLGIDAKMISGHEEARLIYLGVLWSMPQLQGDFAIVDVGGGSTEIIVGNPQQTRFAESYKLGAARLTQRFFRKGKPTPDAIQELHDEVKGVLRPASAAIAQKGGFNQLIGTSGTIQALAKLDRIARGKPHVELHGYKIKRNNLADTVAYIEDFSLDGVKIKGISADRGQTLLAGSIVVLEVMRSLNSKELTVCSAALREGVIVDRFLQTGWLHSNLLHHRDPRSDSVHMLLDKYNVDTLHAEQVARLATEIFRQGQGVLHKHNESVGHLLWSAAMLHDVGTFIGRNGHHKHSYYLIKHAGLLGHSEEEVELISSIARYHRGSEPKDSHLNFNLLKPEDRKIVADMSAILRIAEALDRSHRQVVNQIKLNFGPQPKLKTEVRDLTIKIAVSSKDSCEPEIWALEKKKKVFEDLFKSKLHLYIDSSYTVASAKTKTISSV